MLPASALVAALEERGGVTGSVRVPDQGHEDALVGPDDAVALSGVAGPDRRAPGLTAVGGFGLEEVVGGAEARHGCGEGVETEIAVFCPNAAAVGASRLRRHL